MGDMNKKRVLWVGQAIEAVPAYKQSYDDGEVYQAVKDLLCDLMHFCEDHNEDFDEILDAARDLHDGEVDDDE